MIKCPNCGSTSVIGETDVTIRFVRDEKNKIIVLNEYDDIVADIESDYHDFKYECDDCGEIFTGDE